MQGATSNFNEISLMAESRVSADIGVESFYCWYGLRCSIGV
jgi:hypothetical protein